MMYSKKTRNRRKSAVWIIAFFISLLLWQGETNAFQIVRATPEAVVGADMKMPTDAAFGDDGTLYVLDGYQDRIVIRSPGGRIRAVRPEGTCVLNQPLGITVHRGRIYVANTGNGSVCELDGDGTCLRNVEMEGKGGQDPFVPTDVAIEGGRLVIADRGANVLHLCVYPAFDCVRTVGDFGERGGVLNSPYLVEMKQGRIFATDMMNGRLVLLTESGRFLNALGERGVREGQFVRPKGVVAGPGGSVYVSDSTLGVVQVFDKDFHYIGTIGEKGKPYPFQHPAGLALYQNLLAVVQQRAGTVRLIRLQIP